MQAKPILNGIPRPPLSQEDIDRSKVVFDFVQRGEKWPDGILTAITLIAKGSSLQAVPMMEEFAKSPDPDIRAAALQALILVYHLPEHCQTAWSMLDDEDPGPRSVAAMCVGFCYIATKDVEVMQRLASIVATEDEEWIVRQSAYRSIFDVLNCPYRHPKRPPSGRQMNFEAEVDWEIIAQIQRGEVPRIPWNDASRS